MLPAIPPRVPHRGFHLYLLGVHELLVLVEDEDEVADGGPPVVVPVLVGAVVVEPEGGGGEKRPVMLPLTVPVVEVAVLEAAAAFTEGGTIRHWYHPSGRAGGSGCIHRGGHNQILVPLVPP